MRYREAQQDPWAVGWTIRAMVLIAFLAAFTVPMGIVPIIPGVRGEAGPVEPPEGPIRISLSTPVPTPTEPPVAPIPTATPSTPLIGIVAGHYGHDSGAVCPDGLQEVEITVDVARRVVALLHQKGWEADLLEEFDMRLHGYQAAALVSIHADSCNVPGKTGFKVAGAEASYAHHSTDALVECLSYHYGQRTGLRFDADTITYDMTRYHTFYEIDRSTPAVIIEAGFMLEDRELLTKRSDVVARGITEGIICFVEGNW